MHLLSTLLRRVSKILFYIKLVPLLDTYKHLRIVAPAHHIFLFPIIPHSSRSDDKFDRSSALQCYSDHAAFALYQHTGKPRSTLMQPPLQSKHCSSSMSSACINALSPAKSSVFTLHVSLLSQPQQLCKVISLEVRMTDN